MASDDRRPPSRRYGDEAVRSLLKLATKIQEEEAGRGRGPDGEGLTLAQIQEAAAEAGIDPAYVQRAAARMDYFESPQPGTRWAGTPLMIRTERIIPGEITHEDFWQVPAEMDARYNSLGPGSVKMAGRTLTWKSAEGGERSIQVTVASRMGETRIQAFEDLQASADNLFGGVVGAGGLGVGLGVGIFVGAKVLGSTLFSVLFPIVVIGGLYFGARRLMRWVSAKRRRQLEALVDRIAEYARPDYSAEAQEDPGPPALPG